MAVTETYGGICPMCEYDRMLMRYGSMGWYQFDACPKCGFAYGTNHYDGEDTPEEVWKAVLDANGMILKKLGFPITRQGIFKWIESLDPPIMRERETVFSYSDKEIREYREKNKITLPEKVIFT